VRCYWDFHRQPPAASREPFPQGDAAAKDAAPQTPTNADAAGDDVPAKRCAGDTNRNHLILFGMQNRTLSPYLAAINRILISLVACRTAAYEGMAPWLDSSALTA
jgi:hypothetical protein